MNEIRLAQAIAINGLSPTERLVLINLAGDCDEGGIVSLPQTMLAEAVGVSDQSIRRATNGLIAKGLLLRQRRQRKAARYTVLL